MGSLNQESRRDPDRGGQRKCRRCMGALAATVLLLFPLRTEVVPAWNIRVVDASGAPVEGAVVRQQWKHAPFDTERHEGSSLTRADGVVSFPRRVLRMSLAERSVGLARELVKSDPHADWGRNSIVVASAPGFIADDVVYRPGEPLPAEVRIRRDASGP
jgi:hypothetical protein